MEKDRKRAIDDINVARYNTVYEYSLPDQEADILIKKKINELIEERQQIEQEIEQLERELEQLKEEKPIE